MPSYKRQDLAPTNIPRKFAHYSVEEYFKSKWFDRLEKKFPEWDHPRTSPAAELVVARRQLLDAQEKFEIKLREQQKKREELNGHWRNLKEKEESLRKNFIVFDRFVKENIEKRERAERRTVEEKLSQEQRDRDVEELKKKVADMTAVRDSMKRDVDNYKIYENYLNGVVKASMEFKTLHDILDRFEALTEAKRELALKQQNDLEALETARAEMIRITEEKTQILMGLNNYFANLQGRFERAKSKVHQWQGAVNRVKSTTALKTLETSRVKTACRNLYALICKRKDLEPEYTKDDFENQLAFIKMNILDIKKVIRIAKRKAAKEVVSTPGTSTDTAGAIKIY